MLSRYTDFTRLGQGGMGVVYRAMDTQLHRPVALKFVTAKFGSEDQARARFLREARTAAALNHPAICTIHEIGEVQPGEERLVAADAPFAAGTPFIAMELIEGKALDAVLRGRGRFAANDLLDIAVPIAEALAAAHAKGIVHRDLKPANVMMTPYGRPKILDFGLAKIVEGASEESATAAATETESAELTRRGQVLGTVAYMSPEQAQGKPVDARSDIFSFGVMLYELAAGERPFRGDTPTSTLAKVLETEPKPLGDVRSDLPGELLRIVRRCLRKKPEERFQSTGDLVVALKELKQETASGPTQGWSDAVPMAHPRSRRTVIAWIAAAVVLVAVATAAIVKIGERPTVPVADPTPRQITSNPPENNVVDAAISPDGKFVAFADSTGTYLRDMDSGDTHRVALPENFNVKNLAWFPDGTRLAVTAVRGNDERLSAWTLSILGGSPRKLRDDAAIGSVSRDGSRISYVDMRVEQGVALFTGIWTMGSDGENPRKVVTIPSREESWSDGDWSPDDRKLAFVRGKFSTDTSTASLETIAVDGGPSVVLLNDPTMVTTGGPSCDWLANGSIVFARMEEAPHEDSANLWKIGIDPKSGSALGDPTRLTNLDFGQVGHVSSTRDGKRLAFLVMRREDDVYLGDLAPDGSRLENTRRLTLDDRLDWPTGWSRDGRSVLFTSTRQGTGDVFRQGIEDKTAEVVVSGPGMEGGAVLSPDGSQLLYKSIPAGAARGVERIMRIPVGGGAPELVAELSDVDYFRCSAVAGSSCAVAQNEAGRTNFYALDLLNGKGRRIGGTDSVVPDWSLSTDGSRIAFIDVAGVHLMRVADGTVDGLLAKIPGRPWDVAWSADDQALFIACIAPNGWRLVRAGLDGRVDVLRQSEGRRLVAGIVPSPDGKHLAFGQRTIDSNAWILENF